MDALELAEKIRTQHNGIFAVRLFLGHDGHNVCQLDNQNGPVALGESGSSLLQAVERAEHDWRLKGLGKAPNMDEMIAKCVQGFGDRGDGIFTTAWFQTVVKDDYYGLTLTGDEVAEVLEENPRVVRLSGGCHWLVLPGTHTKHVVESND